MDHKFLIVIAILAVTFMLTCWLINPIVGMFLGSLIACLILKNKNDTKKKEN